MAKKNPRRAGGNPVPESWDDGKRRRLEPKTRLPEPIGPWPAFIDPFRDHIWDK